MAVSKKMPAKKKVTSSKKNEQMKPEHPIDKIFREKLIREQLPPSAGAWEKLARKSAQARSAKAHRHYYLALRLAAMLLLVLMPQFVFWSDLPTGSGWQAHRSDVQRQLVGLNPNPSKTSFEADKKRALKTFVPAAREAQRKSDSLATHTPPVKPNLAQIKTHRAAVSSEKNTQTISMSAHISADLQRIAPIDLLKTIQPMPTIGHLAISESKQADTEKNNNVLVVINISEQPVSKNTKKNRNPDTPNPVFARVWRKVKRLPIGERF